MPAKTFEGRLILLLFAVTWLSAVADDRPPTQMSAEEINAEIIRLQRDVEALRRSPDAPSDWRRSIGLEDKLKEINEKHWKEQGDLRFQLLQLPMSDSAQKWEKRVQILSDRLQALQAENHSRMEQAGRREARQLHNDLKKLAPPSTPELRQLAFDVLS